MSKPIFIQITAPVFPALEKQLLEISLRKTQTVEGAADWLGLGRQTFYNWSKKHAVKIGKPGADTFQSAIRVLIPGSTIPRGFWHSPGVDHVLTLAKEAYRAKAKAAHPDKGGSEADMQALNQAWHIVQTSFSRHGIC